MPDAVEELARKIDRVASGADYETVMRAVILSVGVRMGIHAKDRAALTHNLKRFHAALKSIAEYRFNNKTVAKGDFDDGNWGPFRSP